MRKFISMALAAIVLSASTGCYGEFAAVKGLYNWNGDVSNNKFVQSLLFWGLSIIPVYALFAAGDVIIFNLIEFWSGSNPLSMNEDEVEYQNITYQGKEYQLEASKNQFRLIDGDNEPVILRFEDQDHSWNLITGDETQKLISYHEDADGAYYQVYKGAEVVTLDASEEYSKEMLAVLFSEQDMIAMK